MQMVDFAGQCLYVTAGRNGVIQVWNLNGTRVMPKLDVGSYLSAFHVYAARAQLLAVVSMRQGDKYEVAVWDLAQSVELTGDARFENDSCQDKSFDFLGVSRSNNTTLLVGALGHSHYHHLCAWDLAGETVPPRLRKKYGGSARPLHWTTALAGKIECMAVVRLQDVSVVAVGDASGSVTIIHARDGEILASYRAHDKQVMGVACVTSGGKHVLVSAGLEGTVVGVPWQADVAHRPGAAEFRIETGDRIKSLAPVTGGRLAVGTEQGFLLFDVVR